MGARDARGGSHAHRRGSAGRPGHRRRRRAGAVGTGSRLLGGEAARGPRPPGEAAGRDVGGRTVNVSRTEKMARLLSIGVLDQLARLSWRGLLVFNYHRVGSPTDRDDPDLFSATLEDFDEHVRLLGGRFEIVAAGRTDLDATT